VETIEVFNEMKREGLSTQFDMVNVVTIFWPTLGLKFEQWRRAHRFSALILIVFAY
jgi:predicted ferric reductase